MTEKHADGRRTVANLVDCLLGDVTALIHDLDAEKLRDLENRFHVTMRHHRRLAERASKKVKKAIIARNNSQRQS